MNRLTYAPDLVEEAVLLAERRAPAPEARAFRRERDRIYQVVDHDEREAGFRALHLRWFARLRLDHVVEQVMCERAEVADRVKACRVVRAMTRQDEAADLVDDNLLGAVRGDPTLVLRLRPTTLVEPEILRALLHHELTHVADMLDPSFGYERTLPPSEDGPSADNILRDRYRVLWDATIDGRLARAGLAIGSARDARWQEFAATFAMLGETRRAAFERWFTDAQPTHAELVAFAMTPSPGDGGAGSGRCPLCRFPVASLDRRVETVSGPTLAAIRVNHPAWRLSQGLCTQCLDLYEARSGHRSDVAHQQVPTGSARAGPP